MLKLSKLIAVVSPHKNACSTYIIPFEVKKKTYPFKKTAKYLPRCVMALEIVRRLFCVNWRKLTFRIFNSRRIIYTLNLTSLKKKHENFRLYAAFKTCTFRYFKFSIFIRIYCYKVKYILRKSFFYERDLNCLACLHQTIL